MKSVRLNELFKCLWYLCRRGTLLFQSATVWVLHLHTHSRFNEHCCGSLIEHSILKSWVLSRCFQRRWTNERTKRENLAATFHILIWVCVQEQNSLPCVVFVFFPFLSLSLLLVRSVVESRRQCLQVVHAEFALRKRNDNNWMQPKTIGFRFRLCNHF